MITLNQIILWKERKYSYWFNDYLFLKSMKAWLSEIIKGVALRVLRPFDTFDYCIHDYGPVTLRCFQFFAIFMQLVFISFIFILKLFTQGTNSV